jgi:hypothetical protein
MQKVQKQISMKMIAKKMYNKTEFSQKNRTSRTLLINRNFKIFQIV